MSKSIHVLIVGSGVSGLALANFLVHGNKKNKIRVSIFESRPNCLKELGIGGGIGIWPPSQSLLRNIPDYQNFINQFGFLMPLPSYRDSSGRILARTSKDFNDRFPVQCLERHDLMNLLATGLNNCNDIEIITSQKISHYERTKEQVVLISEDNKIYKGDLLIACDGIHSKIRNALMRELGLPPVLPTDLGYTYFRANTQIPDGSSCHWWSASFETWGSGLSKENETHAVRFGYVPLKPPFVFWFIAIKTNKNHKFLSPTIGVKRIDAETKAFLLDLIHAWQPVRNEMGDIVVDYKELLNLTGDIIRTDIAKIQSVDRFPWTSKDKRIVLMGDAAHATAPNVAQGAGLCIEDAACLASKLNRVDYLHGISEFEQERKPRAKTVQDFADFIAMIGQVKNPLLQIIRNGLMRSVALTFPSLQQHIFDYLVSLSLGGSRKRLYWQAPPLPNTENDSSLFTRVFPTIHLLDKHIKNFKTSKTGGSGFGVVTVEKPSLRAKVIGFLVGLPNEMCEQPFYAEVINLSPDVQLWKRVFGAKKPQQKTYATTHSSYCGFKRKIYLSEGLGGIWNQAFQFIYTIKFQSDKSLKYESQGLTFFNLFKIPLPKFLLPKSVWTEKPTEEGWEFNGTISMPLVGPLLHYYGNFQIEKSNCFTKRRLIIAGGSGMIGKEVCIAFIKKGYDVYCLSRSATTRINIEGVKLRLISEDWSDLINKNTIILNLSGANPGAKRWSSAVKENIAESRYQVIATILANIERACEKPLKYLQASAAGYYGDAGDAVLTEESEPVIGKEPGTKFRVEVCKEIEKRANKANCNVVNLRIGHVLSRESSLWTYLKFFGMFYVGKLGTGNQFVPFVHIHDVVKAIEFIAHNTEIRDGAINLTAPHPCRNKDLLRTLRWVKWGAGLPIPEKFLKLIIGESFVVLTDSERVYPQRLLQHGFIYDFNTLQEVLYGLQ